MRGLSRQQQLPDAGLRGSDVIPAARPHIVPMENFYFEAPAEVFTGGRHSGSYRPMRYLRFCTGAEAVRYVIERQRMDLLAVTVVEINEMRFSGIAIWNLYDSATYPLPRRSTN
jgi:hypothetical protein